MRKHIHQLALIVTLGSGFALAQGMPQQQPTQNQSAASSQTATADVQGNIQFSFAEGPEPGNSTISVQVNGSSLSCPGPCRPEKQKRLPSALRKKTPAK